MICRFDWTTVGFVYCVRKITVTPVIRLQRFPMNSLMHSGVWAVCDRRKWMKIGAMVDTVAEKETEFIFHFSLQYTVLWWEWITSQIILQSICHRKSREIYSKWKIHFLQLCKKCTILHILRPSQKISEVFLPLSLRNFENLYYFILVIGAHKDIDFM